MGAFNSKSESTRSEPSNHVINSKRMWDEIKSYPVRQVSAEQLVKDICSIKDEI